MFERIDTSYETKEIYEQILIQLDALLEGVPHDVTKLAQTAALLNYMLEEINWVGFYLLEENELILGPFQGLPACTPIKLGTGVCGTAAATKSTILVENVHDFPGHIACDSLSQSELVIPILNGTALFGVLDLDAPLVNRFSETDQVYLEQVVHILEKHLSFR